MYFTLHVVWSLRQYLSVSKLAPIPPKPHIKIKLTVKIVPRFSEIKLGKYIEQEIFQLQATIKKQVQQHLQILYRFFLGCELESSLCTIDWQGSRE